MKQFSIKRHFIKKNFLILFCAFVLPTLIFGMVMAQSSWRRAFQEADRRMENSLNLALSQLDNLTNDSTQVNVFIESNSLLSGLSRMMNSRDIPYMDMLSIRHFSSFIQSIVNSENRIDSLYLYLPNSLDRVFTSSHNFVFLENITDQDWVEMMEAGEQQQWLVKREKTDYHFESPRQTLTVFYKFHNFNGGTAVNYTAAEINQIFDSMLFYEQQSILVLNQGGQVLIHNDSITDSEAEHLAQEILKEQPSASPDTSTLQDNNQYVMLSCEYPEYRLTVITSMPRSALFQIALQDARLTLFITLMIVVITIILAYFLSFNSYHHLNQVVMLLDSAGNGDPLPQVRDNHKDMYAQILQNIIRVFLQNNYLQIQLSERKYRLQVAQLQALQYQINPHFLYNTLQTINYEILSLSKGRQTQANRMVENLSDIMRFSLEPMDSFVSLAEELDNCRKYIEIQQDRYGNRFHVIWDIDESLSEAMLLRLLLQPIAENAIVHGLKPNNKDGRIKITVRNRKEMMEVRICDNGVGIERGRLKEIRKGLYERDIEYTAEHIGLHNCCQRLTLAYSRNDLLYLRSKEGMGTLVVFHIPL